MIIGKDKERVRLLEAQCGLAYELIESLRSDLETIQARLEKDIGVGALTNEPYWRIPHDIGRCSGHMSSFRK